MYNCLVYKEKQSVAFYEKKSKPTNFRAKKSGFVVSELVAGIPWARCMFLYLFCLNFDVLHTYILEEFSSVKKTGETKTLNQACF